MPSYYYLSDGPGSVLKTTDASANVVNSYSYDVYGKTTTSIGVQANDRQFARDTTTRTQGLAVSPAYGGGPFGYASANPASATDPLGMDTVWNDSRQVWTNSNNRHYIWTDATGWYDETNGATWTESGGWQSTALLASFGTATPIEWTGNGSLTPPATGSGSTQQPRSAGESAANLFSDISLGLTAFDAVTTDTLAVAGCMGGPEGCVGGYFLGRAITEPFSIVAAYSGMAGTMFTCYASSAKCCGASMVDTLLPGILQLSDPNVGLETSDIVGHLGILWD